MSPVAVLYFQNASFEAVLVTDGLYTYGMFIYDMGSWSLKNPFDSREYIVGYSLADKTGYIYANRHNYTNLNKETNFPNGIMLSHCSRTVSRVIRFFPFVHILPRYYIRARTVYF